MLPMRWKAVPGLGLALVLLQSAPASAELPKPAGQPAPARSADSAFFIARGKNRNEVHYGVHVGEDCRPVGAQPVHAYWRMLEKGEGVTEPLLGIEGPAYGLKEIDRIFVKDKWPAGVAFVMLSGVSADGKSVREVIRP